MSDTPIEWAHAPGFDGETWNPTLGCDKISPGCKSCYAIRSVNRMAGNPNPKIALANAGLVVMTGAGLNWTGKVNAIEERLEVPIRKRKPTCYFVNSLSDLFHDNIPDLFIAQTWATMAVCPRHRFMVLTKRPERMLRLLKSEEFLEDVAMFISVLVDENCDPNERRSEDMRADAPDVMGEDWPLKNIWLGVSVENQATADERIPLLTVTPAAVRFISYEPALGPVDFLYPQTLYPKGPPMCCSGLPNQCGCLGKPTEPPLIYGVHQLIAGGESGPNARPAHPDWFRQARDQCQEAEVKYFFKQWGAFAPWDQTMKPMTDPGRRYVWFDGKTLTLRDDNGGLDFRGSAIMQKVGKKAAGAMLDGREWREFPDGH
jgi:protein gp37